MEGYVLSESLIKLFLTVLSVFYLYNKILNTKTTKRLKFSLNITFKTLIISLGLSCFALFFSTLLITGFENLLFCFTANKILNFFITFLIIGLIQFFIISFPFRFNRLKSGMPFLPENKYDNTGIWISSIIISLTILGDIYNKHDFIFMILSILSALCVGTFFIWWNNQLTQTYIEKLHINEIQILEDEINNLKKDNEKLAKIIHKDNKLIPSMELAVRTILTLNLSKTADKEEIQKIHGLINELNILSNERTGILTIYEHDSIKFPSTASVRLDLLIQYMYSKMVYHKISFNFVPNADIKYMIDNIIDEDSLNTIIADITENAITATMHQNIKNILLSIDLENGCYFINICDSGIPFDKDTFLHLGKRYYTTHKDSGGSGIGLMTTFEILKKYCASFIINEIINSATFTKKVTIAFDGLNQFRVKSDRREIIDISFQRNDLIFE